ncbi:MAG: hypothetical protein D6718_12865 [Acidobacteria bacterium]|nr:MAG: hypothetical protein D6718_12865 [Acidobacteriota bacterium]
MSLRLPRWTAGALLAACACAPGGGGAGPASVEPRVTPDLDAWLAEWPEVELGWEAEGLPEEDRQALDHLLAAARQVDGIFLDQAGRSNRERRERLEALPAVERRKALRLFDINFGPYDRGRAGRNLFLDTPPRPPGAGFYPEDLTPEEWTRFLSEHPDREAELISETTLVVRDEHGLSGRPYSKVFRDRLEAIAGSLEKARSLTTDPALRRYLGALAEALRSDDYREADRLWLEVRGPVRFLLGPHPTGEDRLFGLKASFEALVGVTVPGGAAKVEAAARRLEATCGAPPPDASRVELLDLAGAGGAARAGGVPVAVEFPLDPTPGRTRHLVFRNVALAKSRILLRPAAQALLGGGPEQDGETYVDFLLLHSLAHGRPPRAGPDRLREAAPLLDEARAGLAAALALADRAEGRATVLAALLGALGRGERGAAAARLQLALLEAEGALAIDRTTGRVRTRAEEWAAGLRRALARVDHLVAAGDYAAARRWLDRAAGFRAGRLAAIAAGLPFDIAVRFTGAARRPPLSGVTSAPRTPAAP